MNDTPIIRARKLTHRYGDHRALDQLDLDVPRGQICALLGRNGAGKTTFIRCALGLLRHSDGELQVFGQPAGAQAARRATGAMLQDTDLNDGLSARELLALFASYYEQPADAAALIEQTGIADFADTRYKRLSGGQKRRVQFALALVGRPRLLFLDEPTTGLDADARRAVWDNVRRLAETGTSIVLTTHYLEEADALADRIVVISDGRVLADGPADAIRARTGGGLIRCQTALPHDGLADLPGVRSVEAHGRLVSLLCDDAPDTLRHLLAQDSALSDLEVTKPSLEQAFAALSSPTHGDHG